MKRNLEPFACRIHDAVVVSGTDEEQEMAFDWYQKQAIQEPCPACKAIEEVLREELPKHASKSDTMVFSVYLIMIALSYAAGFFTHSYVLPWLRGDI